MEGQPTCKKCHKPLTDPVSIAVGMGPECRGGGSGSKHFTVAQKRRLRNIYRADAFSRGAPIVIGENTTYYHSEKGWSSDGQHFSTDAAFKSWLEQFQLADFKALEVIEKNRLENAPV